MTKADLTRRALELPISDQLEIAQTLWEHASPPVDQRLQPDLRELLEARLRNALADPSGSVPWTGKRTYTQVMKTISVAIQDSDYEAYERAASVRNQPVDQLIREAVVLYRSEKLESHLEHKTPLRDLPVLEGPRLVGKLPSRAEVYEEIFGGEDNE